MKILHTADWHLGAMLGTRKRYDEAERMLNHLSELCRERDITAILIAGDVFDTPAPGNRATELYYDFLATAAKNGVRDIVVTAGNHDSPRFLDAPKAILKRFRVHVIGRVTDNPADELVPLRNGTDQIEAVVCAVPFLRESDVRTVSASGESFDEQTKQLQKGIVRHYQAVRDAAERSYPGIPRIAMGHLFVTDTRLPAEFQTGSTMNFIPSELPGGFARYALGHLHAPHQVGAKTGPCPMFYSGSPLPLNFSEAEQRKKVLIFDTDNTARTDTVDLPVFRKMLVLTGTPADLEQQIGRLRDAGTEAWIHAENTGPFEPLLTQRLRKWTANSGLELVSCRNRAANPAVIRAAEATESLAELTPEEVFLRYLEQKKIAPDVQTELRTAFREITDGLADAARNRE